MAIDFTYSNVASGYNLSRLNNNFAQVDSALQDGLSRSGNGPNEMNADLDMNGNSILNLGAPVNPNDPIRLQDISPTAAAEAAASAAAALVSETNAAASEANAAVSETVAAAAEKSIGWVFDTSVTMSDPGDSNIRFNNASLASVTAIAVDATDFQTNDVSDYVSTWGSSTATVKGSLIVRKAGSATDFAIYHITSSVTDNSGWLQLTVSHVQSSGSFSSSDVTYLHFTRTGDDGASGAGSGDMLAANNLSDLANVSTARSNLGLGDLATQSSVAVGQINNSVVDTLQVADNAITLDKVAHGTAGTINLYDVSGAPTALAVGTAGQVLTTQGAGALPTWEDAASGSGAALHDITSSSDVTLTVAAANTAADKIAAGKVIATKASVPLLTTDMLIIDLTSLVNDGSAIAINTQVDVWVRINSAHSVNGLDKNGTTQLADSRAQLSLSQVNVGEVNTYTKSGDSRTIQLLASDFIGSDGSYTVDIMASARNGDDTTVIKGTTATTTFKLRVMA